VRDDSQHCECPVCEEPWVKDYYDKDQPEVWRFEAHSRPYLDSKGKLVKGVGCPGEGKSLDEAWEIKHYLDATGGKFPDG
jgi:hypothetical protein